jgi:hypothetical protein
MDGNYDWSDGVFRDSAGASLNLAVNVLADVLHGVAVVGIEEDDPPVVTGSVSGRVVDEDGAGLEGAMVGLRDDDTWVFEYGRRTKPDGTFKINNVALGEYTMVVGIEGYLNNETLTVTVSEGLPSVEVGDVELEMGAEGEIRGAQNWTLLWVVVGLLIGVSILVLFVFLGTRKGRRKRELE